jgi:hypothetical protein
VKQIIIGMTLFLFLGSSFLGGLEELSTNFDADSQTFLWTLDDDSSSDNTRGRRGLKRLQRGKSSLKGLRAVDKPARETFLIAWIKETEFLPRSPKSSVYQQTNVYRI